MFVRAFPSCLLLALTACGRPDASGFWAAMAAADVPAARRVAANPGERRCAEALATALAAGSEAADELIAIGADDADAGQRDWARRLLLSLLRHEGDWPRLAALRERHPELELSATAIPAAMTAFPRAQITPPTEPSQLPWLDHGSGLPVVAVRFAGDRTTMPAEALLDTGAGLGVVTDEFAEQLGARFVSDQPLPLFGIAGQTHTARAAVLAELQLGAWTVREVPVAVVAPEHLRLDGHDLRALIGWDLLRHVRLELSAKQRTIVVDRSRAGAPDVEPNLVLLTEPLVRLPCNDRPALLLLDTGSTFTQVARGLVRRLDLATRPAGRQTVSGIGGDTTVDVEHVVQLTVRCGPTQLTLGDLPAYEVPAPHAGLPAIDGALGIDVLSAVHVVLDGPARTLTLRAN